MDVVCWDEIGKEEEGEKRRWEMVLVLVGNCTGTPVRVKTLSHTHSHMGDYAMSMGLTLPVHPPHPSLSQPKHPHPSQDPKSSNNQGTGVCMSRPQTDGFMCV